MALPLAEFEGMIAVVTGGGTGIGRELVKQLSSEGCRVAMCDVNMVTMEETKRQCEFSASLGRVEILCYVADVADEAQLLGFRQAVADRFQTDKIQLLFNNAGIGGGGSFVSAPRAEWEHTFNVCWCGVYYSCRAFLTMLLNAERAHIANTSSVNGFWASLGPKTSNTAYSAAKFAIKGFTEGLITDLRLTAPHVTCSVVMPGYIGTAMMRNTQAQLYALRDGGGSRLDEDQLKHIEEVARAFEDNAPTSAAQAAKTILDGVRTNSWRILVGDDARRIDAAVRAQPDRAYDEDFTRSAAPAIKL